VYTVKSHANSNGITLVTPAYSLQIPLRASRSCRPGAE
jgi:hypothetical protein